MASTMENITEQMKKIPVTHWIFYSVLTLVYIAVTLYIELRDRQREWHCLTIYGYICTMLAIGDGRARTFFRPIDEETSEKRGAWSFLMLTSTSFISWIMAKSVQNSSKLGGKYGVVGGLAYASWFVGIFTTAVIVYQLRKMKYYSLPDFINNRYGKLSCIVFLLTVGYRLYNEVWSNTIVIADFFGDRQSWSWYFACWVGAGIPMVYTMLGGMRASLISDAVQTVLAYALLLATFFVLQHRIANDKDLRDYANEFHDSASLWRYNPDTSREMWSLRGGLDLFLTGIIQGALSYTFMDPALTDRAFLASKELMLGAFAVGSLMAIVFITLFGFIGTYGNMVGNCVDAGYCNNDLHGADIADLKAGLPSDTGLVLGPWYYTLLSLIMITSAISTLDSTFSAVAKVVGPDLHGIIVSGRPVDPGDATDLEVNIGRVFIAIIAIAGTLPIYSDPDELDATTVSGTMVPGLGPPIYCMAIAFFFYPSLFSRFTSLAQKRPVLFMVPFLYGAALGVVYQLASQDENCYSSSALKCDTPRPASTNSEICSNYNTYFSCVSSSGCWTNMLATDCKEISDTYGCSMGCHKNDEDYWYFVDLSGFNIGTGSYAKLLGVNVISAAGALFLFLFANMDQVLEYIFPEDFSILDQRFLESGKAQSDSDVEMMTKSDEGKDPDGEKL